VRRSAGGRWERVDFERPVDQEFVAFIESRGRRGADAHQIVSALWIEKEMEAERSERVEPSDGRRIGPISAKTLSNLVTRTRAQLGPASDGRLFLPKRESPNQPIALDVEMFGADYRRFVALVARADAAPTTPAKIALLRRALSLVEGAPYDAADHEWATGLRTELQERVGDAAARMAELCLEPGVEDPAGVRFAVARARMVDPEADPEVLIHYEMRAAGLEGDPGGIRTVMRRAKERRGPDERLDRKTEALYSELLSASG
jgi:hypothetical protein